jgi:hypothetical protein
MDVAKIRLSKEELALVMDPGWILTKNSIMGKVGRLFAELSGELQESLKLEAISSKLQAISLRQIVNKSGLPLAADSLELAADALPFELPFNWATPKISKGENYKGLPYMVLDYPRAFGREDVFAIRTFFWWGHYFSVTLHLKGRYKTLFLPVIQERIGLLAAAGFHISVSEDEWRHELDADHYMSLQGNTGTVILKERKVLKLSAKCGLERWDDADSVLLELNRVLAEVLGQ